MDGVEEDSRPVLATVWGGPIIPVCSCQGGIR